MNDLTSATNNSGATFDSIKQVRADGSEYWSARDLMGAVNYDRWENFRNAIDKAIASAEAQGFDAVDLFRGVTKKGSGRPQEDFELVRFAAYLVMMNGDPRKPEIAAAQGYFAIKTREAEVARPALTEDEIIAQALQITTRKVEALTEQVGVLTPKAEAFDDFLSTRGDMSVNEAAKALARAGHQIGEGRLRQKLIEWGWIYRQSAQPRAKQAQIDLGRMSERQRFHYHPQTGEKVLDTPQVRITPKGLEAIGKRLEQGLVIAS